MKQLSEEWFAARLGNVSASRVADLMATTKSGPSASRKNYMMELLCQRLTGEREDGYTNAAMQRGIDLEPVARSAYEIVSGKSVEPVGFVMHPVINHFGASPDGLIDDAGLIEIKCPNTAQHVACLRSREPDPKYFAQMQAQMACTSRAWCDYVSFDDRLPEPLQLFVCRQFIDPKWIEEMEKSIAGFLFELAQLESEMIQLMENKA